MAVVLVVVLTIMVLLVDQVVVVLTLMVQVELEIQTLLQHIKEIPVEMETHRVMELVVEAVVPVVLV
jgi:hypothetical protein